MEDSSLHGFIFRPQTPLLVSDQNEADYAETETGEWQESLGYEGLNPLPSSDYRDEANQTSSAECHDDDGYHSQRICILSRVDRRRQADRHLLESIDSDSANTNSIPGLENKMDAYDWYASCSSLAQPNREDEFRWEGSEPGTPEINAFSDGASMEPASQEYSEAESESDASTMTLAGVCEDEAAASDIVDSEDENSLDSEDEGSSNSKGEDSLGFGDENSYQIDESCEDGGPSAQESTACRYRFKSEFEDEI